METQDCSAIAVHKAEQQEEEAVGMTLELKTVGEDVVAVVVQEDEWGEVIYCHYCKEPSHTKYNCPLLEGKQQQLFRSTNVVTTQEENLRVRVLSMRSRCDVIRERENKERRN